MEQITIRIPVEAVLHFRDDWSLMYMAKAKLKEAGAPIEGTFSLRLARGVIYSEFDRQTLEYVHTWRDEAATRETP